MVDWKKSFMNQHEFFDTRFDRYPYERKAGILKRTDDFFILLFLRQRWVKGRVIEFSRSIRARRSMMRSLNSRNILYGGEYNGSWMETRA